MSAATASPVMSFQAEELVNAAKGLAHFVGTTPEDRLSWKPKCEETGVSGRSVYEQLGEVIDMNRGFAAILKGAAPGERHSGNFASVDDAKRQVVESAEELASAVRDLDESVMTKTFPLPWGEWSGRMLVTVPLTHMAYHSGQVNYIQVLYGDNEFHVPGL